MPNSLSVAPRASSRPTPRSPSSKQPNPKKPLAAGPSPTTAPRPSATAAPTTTTPTIPRPPIHDVVALAKEFGWTHLNPDEKRLIDTLRWTTWHGRALVMEVALSLRTSHPWMDGAGQRNTASPLIRDGDGA